MTEKGNKIVLKCSSIKKCYMLIPRNWVKTILKYGEQIVILVKLQKVDMGARSFNREKTKHWLKII